MPAVNFIDMTGRKIGRLTVVKRVFRENVKLALWECICDCGNTIVAYGTNLRRENHTTSCGCLQKEKTRDVNYKHGESSNPLWAVWYGMLSRCTNPKNKYYKNYGGAGIKVCDRWLEFMNFKVDMEESYQNFTGEKPTLERKRFDEDYSKENCEWIDKRKQNYNTSMHSTNTTGVTGVSFYSRGYYSAEWRDYPSGKKCRKFFSIKKLGVDEAFSLAVEFRKKKIEEQIEKGAPYTKIHGLPKNTKIIDEFLKESMSSTVLNIV